MRVQPILLIIGVALFSFGFASSAQSKPKSQAERLFARAKAEDYTGDEACAKCHVIYAKNFASSPHAPLVFDPSRPLELRGCEGCHGPGNIHQSDENPEVIAFRKMTPKESSAACLRCHEKTLSESHWKRSEHARADLSCVSCHQIHPDSDSGLGHAAKKVDPKVAMFVARPDPKAMLRADEAKLCGSCHQSALAEFRSSNHHPLPEGRIVCSDCHSPHPTKDTKVKQDAFKSKCATCHAERAGPFVYEHDPVAGFSGDGCLECHRPHGTNNTKLLKSATRGLCGQCHTDKMAQHFPALSCWTASCHVAQHGSNTDPLFLKP